MKKLLTLSIGLIFNCAFLVANTTGIVSGVIFDDAANTPLVDAIISIENYKIVSDSSGNFTLPAIEIGKHTLTVEKLGYQTKQIDISIEANTVKTLRVYLKYNTLQLSEVLIKTDRATSAATSTVVNAIDFQLRPINSAQDMLRNVPGLFTAQHAGGGKAEQIFLRGFDCDHGTDVAGFVDGIPINMPTHGHGQGYLDMHFLIPETVKNVDIVKGPYFAELGDFATAGAVKFKTLDRIDKNTVQLELGTTPTQRAFSNSRALMMYQLPFKNDKISSYIASEYIFAPGYFDASQNFKRFSFMSKTKIELTENSSLSLLLTHFNSDWDASGQIPTRAVDLIGFQNPLGLSRFGSVDNSEGGNTSRQNASLTYENLVGFKNLRGLGLFQSFKAQAYVSKYDFNLFSNFTFFKDDTINGDEINQKDNRYVAGLNTEYTLNAEKNKFTIGAGLRFDNIENRNNHVVKRQYLNAISAANVSEMNNFIFVKDNFKITDKLSAELGLRFNYLNFDVTDLLPSDSSHINYTGKNYQTQIAPKINLTYALSDRNKLFVNFGRGFHSNDARAVVQDAGNHALPDLFGGEIGVLLHPLKNTIISAALWGMELANELVFNGDDGTTSDNGASRRIGLDVSLRSNVTPWLSLDADINYAHGRLVEKTFGQVLATSYFIPLAPSLSSTGGASVHFKNGIEGSLRYRHLNNRPAIEDNSITALGYTVVDLNAFYKKDNYRIGFHVDNLLNVKWNEAQFATESRLKNETASITELNFTPGTPFNAKFVINYYF